MGLLDELGRRLRMLGRRARLERDLDEEMRLHVDLREARLRDEGLRGSDAGAAAERRFGNRLRLREDAVDAWGWRWLDQLGQDARFGARTLAKNPVFAATAILTLALATGATTAIFSVVNGVVLRPLPFADPDRLVQLHGRNWREDRGGPPDTVTGPVVATDLDAFASESRLFDGFAAYFVGTRHVEGAGGLERLNVVVADPELFSVLGVPPIVGRTFQPDDGVDVAVISGRLWRERFERAPSLAARTITLDGHVFTIVGAMAEQFQFPYRAASLLRGALPESRTDVWVPNRLAAQPRRGRMSVVARMKRGVSIERASAELQVIAARVEQRYAASRIRVGARLVKLSDAVIGPVRRSLWMLFAAVGLVLAAACANVANLLLARTSVRTREVVTRAALGAGRLRLARQFLAESLLLGLAGGVAGAAFARWGTSLLVRLGEARIPRAHEVALDWQAFAFLLAACVLTAMLFGLAPALAAARMDVHGITKEAGRATIGRGYRYVRDGLVAIEVALAFILAIGATLVMREIIRLEQVNPGMVTGNVVVLHLTPRAPAADYYAIEDRVSQIPGVLGAGLIQMVPLQNWGWEADFDVRGQPPAPGQRRTTELRYVTPGYFRAFGIPILRGRGLLPGDTEGAPPVVVVNDALARRYFANEDPVGRVLNRGTIVGVVGDVRSVHLDRPAEPELYYPAAQNVAMTSDLGMSLVVRTAGPAEPMIPALRAAVRAVTPNLAIFNVKMMEQVVADSLWDLRLYRWLIGLFAGLTLLLAAIGLYGVISYTATSRTREFAIRLALGSRAGALARLVLGRGLVLAAAGVAFGAFATYLLRSTMRGLPIAGGPDAATYAAISAVLVVIALAACAIPALRAAAVDPVTALRHE
jgi:predicted permease